MNDYSNHQNIYKKSTMIKMSALFVCLNKKVNLVLYFFEKLLRY